PFIKMEDSGPLKFTDTGVMIAYLPAGTKRVPPPLSASESRAACSAGPSLAIPSPTAPKSLRLTVLLWAYTSWDKQQRLKNPAATRMPIRPAARATVDVKICTDKRKPIASLFAFLHTDVLLRTFDTLDRWAPGIREVGLELLELGRRVHPLIQI